MGLHREADARHDRKLLTVTARKHDSEGVEKAPSETVKVGQRIEVPDPCEVSGRFVVGGLYVADAPGTLVVGDREITVEP